MIPQKVDRFMHNVDIHIGDSRLHLRHPEGWDELTSEQFINVVEVIEGENFDVVARCNIINMFLGVQDPLMELPDELIKLSDFILKPGALYKNMIPSVKLNKKSGTLIGPGDYLRNITISEFAFADRFFLATQGTDESGEWVNLIRSLCDGDVTKLDQVKDVLLHNILYEMETRLTRARKENKKVVETTQRKKIELTADQKYDFMCKMIAVIYRDAEEQDPEEWDPRIKFNEKEIDKRAKIVKTLLDDKTKYAILLNYRMIRKWLEDRYKIVFESN